jgi:DNA polymerase-1
MTSTFSTVINCDFEYEVDLGNMPKPLCMVAEILDENLHHVRTIRMWRGEFGASPPFPIGPDALFCCYAGAPAELACFMQLGWSFPVHVFDQWTAYLAASNFLKRRDEDKVREPKDLATACRAYGLDGWHGINKDRISAALGEGRWREYGKEAVLAYCSEDVRMSVLLLREQLRGRGRLVPADTDKVIHWSNYSAKAVARIQARGVPLDMELWNLIQENKLTVVRELIRRFDPSYDDDEPICNEDGEFSRARFEAWLARREIYAWPRKPSGELGLRDDDFKLMAHLPGIEGLRALRGSLNFILRTRMPIGRDGRSRCSLFPFNTTTGRNAHSRSIFNAHSGMRSLIKFPRDAIGAYLDFRTQEMGIAAALSGDEQLHRDYLDGDIYHSLAKMCGLTTDPDRHRWKAEHPDDRQRMKSLLLGVNYGMKIRSVARGLDRHPVVASAIMEKHRLLYPVFWRWLEQVVLDAMQDRKIESAFGWPLRLTSSPNERTLFNYKMQSLGGDMLRIAAVGLDAAGIVPVMLVHDGILLEETDPSRIKQAREIMLSAGRQVCGFEIGVDVDKELRDGARFRDKRESSIKLWGTIMDALRSVGVTLPDGV